MSVIHLLIELPRSSSLIQASANGLTQKSQSWSAVDSYPTLWPSVVSGAWTPCECAELKRVTYRSREIPASLVVSVITSRSQLVTTTWICCGNFWVVSARDSPRNCAGQGKVASCFNGGHPHVTVDMPNSDTSLSHLAYDMKHAIHVRF